VKLNVGCGEFYADGWTNVDVAENDHVKPDMICSLQSLGDEVRDVGAVYLGHVLEHVDPVPVITSLRKLWESCVLGCRVAVVGPDVLRAWNGVMDGTITYDDAVGATLGARRWPGDEHRWVCYEEELVSLVRASGLTDARGVPIGSSVLNDFPVVSRAGWQCAVIGSVWK
jgi:predicted SAM-dependent methyltransferase